MESRMGPLIIVSGPSGSGKSTIIRRLLNDETFPLRLSVSVTTRQPRINEQPGVHYHYYTLPEFEDAKGKNEFLEWAEVHGNYYGTLENEVTQYREIIGEGVILDIDVQGAAQVRKRCPDAVSIFVKTSQFETLEKRLRARHTETDQGIEKRLENARIELARANECDHVVINDDLESALAAMRAILGPLFGRS
jgi:guanylate kinase